MLGVTFAILDLSSRHALQDSTAERAILRTNSHGVYRTLAGMLIFKMRLPTFQSMDMTDTVICRANAQVK
ncbi:hypothetical protein RRG08_058842 [Elysia crispata]|uniref:Uncharacterized protein n=1 Tax=Elysia crispata TaxID=231223 RepID=A0AAE0Y0V4_9GAST|nr:hypothetical protein RRG08_058842 [Elysia crispata]